MITIVLEQDYMFPGIMISDTQKLLFPVSFLNGTPLDIIIEYESYGDGRVQTPYTVTGGLSDRHPENAAYWVLPVELGFDQHIGDYIIFEGNSLGNSFWTNLINTTQT